MGATPTLPLVETLTPNVSYFIFPTPSTFLHRFEAGGRVMDSSNLSGPNSGDQWTRWTLWPGSGLQSAEVPRSPEVLVKFTPLQHPEQAVFNLLQRRVLLRPVSCK